jgi:hypothetical protein
MTSYQYTITASLSRNDCSFECWRTRQSIDATNQALVRDLLSMHPIQIHNPSSSQLFFFSTETIDVCVNDVQSSNDSVQNVNFYYVEISFSKYSCCCVVDQQLQELSSPVPQVFQPRESLPAIFYISNITYR